MDYSYESSSSLVLVLDLEEQKFSKYESAFYRGLETCQTAQNKSLEGVDFEDEDEGRERGRFLLDPDNQNSISKIL